MCLYAIKRGSPSPQCTITTTHPLYIPGSHSLPLNARSHTGDNKKISKFISLYIPHNSHSSSQGKAINTQDTQFFGLVLATIDYIGIYHETIQIISIKTKKNCHSRPIYIIAYLHTAILPQVHMGTYPIYQQGYGCNCPQ